MEHCSRSDKLEIASVHPISNHNKVTYKQKFVKNEFILDFEALEAYKIVEIDFLHF